ncbi:MAG: hypothetical protein GWN77_06015, partial [Gammaproteobacteria bacterium]|nr:hypothetical protein [Gammaproteobacteria bacterium]
MRIGKDPLSIAQSRFVKENIQEADVLSVNNETHSAVVRLRNNNQTMRISLGSVDPIYVKDDRARVLVYTSPFGGATAISFIGTKPTVASSPGVTLGDAHGGTQWCIYNSNGLPIFCVDSSGTQLVTYGVYVAYSYDVPD